MRAIGMMAALGLLAGLMACGKDEITLPQKDIIGKIDGEDWELKFSNGYLYSSGFNDFKYQFRFLSTSEPGDDPCAIPSTSRPHLSIIMRPQIGSFSLPLPINEESARFHLAPGNSQIATSGFLEVFDIVNGGMFGYIQAQLDDNNMVEGSFKARLCN